MDDLFPASGRVVPEYQKEVACFGHPECVVHARLFVRDDLNVLLWHALGLKGIADDAGHLLGRPVETITSGSTQAGRHTVQLDATGWASGLYLVRMTVADRVFERSILLVK